MSIRPTTSLLVDLLLPLAVLGGLCALGVNQWLALALGETWPVARLGRTSVRRGRLEVFPICALVVVACTRIACTWLVAG